MKFTVLFLLLFCVDAVSAREQNAGSGDKNPSVEKTSRLPADAARVVDRLAACVHFSGEFNGDGSDRDKEVATAMTELQCDRIEQDVLVIRKKYRNSATVQAALDSASDL